MCERDGGRGGGGARVECILPVFFLRFPRVLYECFRQGPAREGLAMRATILTSAALLPILVRG